MGQRFCFCFAEHSLVKPEGRPFAARHPAQLFVQVDARQTGEIVEVVVSIVVVVVVVVVEGGDRVFVVVVIVVQNSRRAALVAVDAGGQAGGWLVNAAGRFGRKTGTVKDDHSERMVSGINIFTPRAQYRHEH